MKIILNPQRRDDLLQVFKCGDVLVVNGDQFDFSMIGEGDVLPASAIQSAWFCGDVERIDGELIVRMWLPNPENYTKEQAFPEPLIDVPDGIVNLPGSAPELEIANEH